MKATNGGSATKSRLRGSLESRLCVLISGLLFALLLAIGHFQMSSQASALVEGKAEKYEVLSKALALSYVPLVKGDDATLYKAFAERFMDADKDISYILIADSKGRTLFADSRTLSPKAKRSFIGRQASGLLRFIRRLDPASDSGFDAITIPTLVGPNQRGAITVGYGSHSMDQALDDLQARILCIFACAFIIGLLGAVSLAKAITGPLCRLIKAARTVAGGDLDVVIPVTSSDEVGELASTFNRMVAALRDTRDRLVERANTDSLTELFNHRYFQERLAAEISRSDRYDRPVSIIILDIDHFKGLNDTHGHPVGDSVLQNLGKLLQASVRDIDIVARYGGEEFAIILPETTQGEAEMAAERLRVAVQRHCFMGKEGETLPVSISLGVAQYPVHSTEREGLVMAADLAMYQAKSMGRNRAVVFNNDIRKDKDSDPYKLYLLLHATDISTIEAMAAAVDAKGQRQQGFSRDVMIHSVALARELGLSEKEQGDVRIASLLHDIGKLGISDTILTKQGGLTDEERRIVKSHPALGFAIVQKSPHLRSMLPGILYHHEWWNGNGYPNCLKGEEIPLIARIISIVDSYHAMLTVRAHTKPMTPEQAREELRRCAGTQFDPKLVDVFVQLLENETEHIAMQAA